jgi:hypothetical protein
MNRRPLRRAYVLIRIVASICIAAAIVSAIAGLRIAGPFLLASFAIFAMGGLLNLWLGLTVGRVLLGSREIAREGQPAIFWLWFVLNAFLLLLIGTAVAFAIIVRSS